MQCREFEQRLQLAADLRRDPPADAEFDLHASLCADCSAKREWFVALGRMTDAFRTKPELAAADGGDSLGSYDRGRLIRETFSRASQEDRQAEVVRAPAPVVPVRSRSKLLYLGSGLAIAASIALFVTLAFLPPSQPAGDGTDVALAPSVATVPEEVSAPVVIDVPSVDSAAIRPGFTLSGVEGPLSLQQLRERLTSLPGDPSMTGSLRPITSSFGVAWETLRSALPTGHADADPALDQADARGTGPIAVA
jgi:hypothetical protein